ncbi:hypothetical protein SAMN05216412_102477 [Nitrosospira multiformis]|uniref:Uncharacterized protein n=1 Tax=Nitrosospira multiformis TaxID=1231 RepID=A0A1I0B1F4_9PROT|nr:hypothetical protein SAMN05216412_102477 [Nitrosospira multiformis]
MLRQTESQPDIPVLLQEAGLRSVNICSALGCRYVIFRQPSGVWQDCYLAVGMRETLNSKKYPVWLNRRRIFELSVRTPTHRL